MGGSNDGIHQKGRVMIKFTRCLGRLRLKRLGQQYKARLANNENKGIENDEGGRLIISLKVGKTRWRLPPCLT